MKIAVIDGQGGGIGKHLTDRLRKELGEEVEILALATNALATSLMLKAGANEGASGENAIVYNCPRVDVIVGPVGIVMPNAMLGEITAKIAEAIVSSPAPKILLPILRGNVELVGLQGEPLPHLMAQVVDKVKKHLV
ncbi:MAG TPA: DUF3842 family protein [Bacillota bacterium]|nr:DUF3842 family protein [Bacillota bacterium]